MALHVCLLFNLKDIKPALPLTSLQGVPSICTIIAGIGSSSSVTACRMKQPEMNEWMNYINQHLRS